MRARLLGASLRRGEQVALCPVFQQIGVLTQFGRSCILGTGRRWAGRTAMTGLLMAERSYSSGCGQ